MSPLRAWRLANGLSLREVGDLCGASASWISRVERGQKKLSPLGKVKIARRLGVRVRDLFEVEEVEESSEGDEVNAA